ncbi:MAG: glycoside hydrolase family 3 N-terminal domain-containing protein [Niabella sp.]
MNWKIMGLFFSLFVILHLEILASAQADRSYKDPSVPIEQRIEDLVSRMLLEEKIGQMNQLHFRKTDSSLKDKVRQGSVGSLLNIVDLEEVNQLQKIALTQSRLGIPLIIGRDIIHGFKTIFPIPLGLAASFDYDVVKLGAHIAAKEAREKGINWTFAPMLDISRDARWGRIAESFGEDPYLAGVLGVAMVKGFQGENLSGRFSIAACLKHFAGYGAAEGGRDYNSTNIPPHSLRNIYLAPFQKAINAGAATVMTSFNENDGIPSSGNEFLLKQVLRKEWKFDGFVVSDWASVPEMITHGYANDRKHAVQLAANAGLDMEMATRSYIEYLPQLVKENNISIAAIDSMVKNILRIKFRMGLFEDPYVKPEAPSTIYSANHLQAARDAAVKSAILLKNENNLLPLSPTKKI